MRLLVVTQYFWPEQFRINELVSELEGRGHQITVLTGKPNYPTGIRFPDFVADPARFSTYGSARVIRVPMVSRGANTSQLLLNYVTFAISASVVGLTRLRDDRFDAMLVFEPSPITVGIPAIVLRRFRGWPIAFWVLDQWPETLAAVGVLKSGALLGVIGRLVAFIYRRCDLILAQSKALIPQIRAYCEKTARIEYFPNWVESPYSSSNVEAAVEIPPRDGTFDVLFAGNVGESQDFPAILDAAAELAADRVRWLILGDGRMSQWVKDEVVRRGLQEHVLLLGRHEMERMPAFFQHANAMLVSLKAGSIFSMTIPGKLQSYLASGIPVLGMLDGEGARVIRESASGLTCAAGDSKMLAENVRRMASMSAIDRERMGANGRDYARREFDRDAIVSRLEDLMATLTPTTATVPA